jgi:Skp family chaperone for outer membrane proteins
MKRLLVTALLAAAASASAEPRIQSAEECIGFADLALVAATLAKHEVAREKTDTMLPDMYELEADRAKEVARRIVDVAYVAKGSEPKAFAASFAQACLRSGGRLDRVLGTSL